jgi:hypothetical protein
MSDKDTKDKIKDLLVDITKKKHILITKRGNASIEEVMKLAKTLGREKVLIQDQGGWITYKQFANKHGLMCIELKTDYGLTNLEDLEKKADGKSILIVNSLTGYHAEEDMKKISEICEKKHCLLVNDVSGSIGLKIATYGNIILGSFNKWKPVNLGFAGFLAFDDKVPSHFEIIPETKKLVQKFFDIIPYFKISVVEKKEPIDENTQESLISQNFQEYELKEKDLEKLYEKIKNVGKRNKFFSEIHWKIKKELKKFEIIHPKSYGINVIVKFNNEEEKNKIIKYCDDNKYEYTECPRYIRVNENAISIEVKRL